MEIVNQPQSYERSARYCFFGRQGIPCTVGRGGKGLYPCEGRGRDHEMSLTDKNPDIELCVKHSTQPVLVMIDLNL